MNGEDGTTTIRQSQERLALIRQIAADTCREESDITQADIDERERWDGLTTDEQQQEVANRQYEQWNHQGEDR